MMAMNSSSGWSADSDQWMSLSSSKEEEENMRETMNAFAWRYFFSDVVEPEPERPDSLFSWGGRVIRTLYEAQAWRKKIRQYVEKPMDLLICNKRKQDLHETFEAFALECVNYLVREKV